MGNGFCLILGLTGANFEMICQVDSRVQDFVKSFVEPWSTVGPILMRKGLDDDDDDEEEDNDGDDDDSKLIHILSKSSVQWCQQSSHEL